MVCYWWWQVSINIVNMMIRECVSDKTFVQKNTGSERVIQSHIWLENAPCCY